MTKRLLCLLLATALTLSLAACSEQKSENKEGTTTAATTTVTTTTTTVPESRYYVTASSLNVRCEPSTDSEILGKLPLGAAVEVLQTADGWCRISFNGIPAYVSEKYLSRQQPSTTAPPPATTLPANTILYVTATKLNVRREPVANGEILAQLPYGTAVTILETVDGWYRVDFQGETAYVSADYLSATPPSGVSAVSTTKAYPDASIPPLKGGLTEGQRTDLYAALRNLLNAKGKDYKNVYAHVNDTFTLGTAKEGKSIEQMAYDTLSNQTVSAAHIAAYTYLLMKEAGYQVDFVRGLNGKGAMHCWIMFKDTDGWYFMDTTAARSSKLTTQQLTDLGYRWNPTVHPTAK